MAIVTARVDMSELESLAKRLSNGEVRRAVSRGLNDSIRQGRTVSRKGVGKRYNIPLNQITRSDRGKMLDIGWAKSNSLQARLYASVSESTVLSRFRGTSGGGVTLKRVKDKNKKYRTVMRRGGKNLSQPLTGKKKRLVAVKLLKGGVKKEIDQAFIAKTKSGHVGVFGRGRYTGRGAFNFSKKGGKMQELGAMTLFKAMSSRHVEKEIMDKARSAAPRRIKFWLQRYLGIE